MKNGKYALRVLAVLSPDGGTMNIEQITARAGSVCAPPTERRGVTVRVSAPSGDVGAEDCFELFKEWAAEHPPAAALRTGSMGYDDLEPVAIVEKPCAPAVFYPKVTRESVSRLIEAYLEGSDPRTELAPGVLSDEAFKGIPSLYKQPLFKLQRRSALRRCGFVDPESIDHFIAAYGGYRGLSTALRTASGELPGILAQAGGRAADALCKVRPAAGAGERKIVCNALECVPEARASRLLLEGDPHAVLEGLLIAACASGASKAILAVPAGSTAMRRMLDRALSQMRAYGLVGADILESGFGCEIEVRDVPVTPASWEPTALLRFLEGRQAIPFLRGKDDILTLDGVPALFFDCATLANVAAVLRDGPDAGGTKIVTLAGDVAHAYTVEVPLDTPVGALVREIGGLSEIKAVQCASPTGGYLGAGQLDQAVGHVMRGASGDGVCPELLAAVESGACVVESAARAAERLHDMSCGKCVFCREGTLHLAGLLDNLAKGGGRPGDLKLMEELGRNMKTGCICALGRSAAEPVLSSLGLFRPEYEHHLKHKQCPEGLKGGAGHGER